MMSYILIDDDIVDLDNDETYISIHALLHLETSQELQILSSVTLNCQVTTIILKRTVRRGNLSPKYLLASSEALRVGSCQSERVNVKHLELLWWRL